MRRLGAKKVAKSSSTFFECKICDYITSRKSNFEKHLLTDKHKKRAIVDRPPHFCSCGKSFTRSDSLYRHKKTCIVPKISLLENEKVANLLPNAPKTLSCICGVTFTRTSNLKRHQKTCRDYLGNEGNSESSQVLELLTSLKDDNTVLKKDYSALEANNRILCAELQDLKTGVMTAVSEPKVINNYNNIVVLLNQKCGDAIAITDFANHIAMSLEDVNYALENGKVKGIENIIRKKFDELGTFSRPMHCTDIKRGTMYIKGQEGWEKDKGEMTKMIRDVEFAQTKGITVWGDANPDYSKGNSRLMDKWLRIVNCLTDSIDGIGLRRIERRCHEICKIDHESIT